MASAGSHIAFLTASLAVLLASAPLSARKQKPLVPDSLQVIDTAVNGIPLRMRRVEGGSFVMGATSDQFDRDLYSDKPAHLVFLAPFYIAETEVTYQLWHSVMPEHESLHYDHYRLYPNHPVSYVSWIDCQEFVRRIDSITGLPFRLPTEAEWEFAARGGNMSRHYRFAGSDEADSVGWTNFCSGNFPRAVARKRPNELGIYDMTGNVAEWCQDWYAPYQIGTQPDPCVCDSGTFKIARGGSYDDCIANSHISVRRWYPPEMNCHYIGLRVAFTLPGDPMMQTPEKEPALTKKLRIGSRKLHFTLIPTENPYYLSEEISVTLWRKIMQRRPPKNMKDIAVGMTPAERARFAELCSRESNELLQVASAEEVVAAEKQGLVSITKSDNKRHGKTQTTHQIQRRRKSAAKWTVFTELVGIRLPQPDDPVLLQYKKEDDEVRPLRLVIRQF